MFLPAKNFRAVEQRLTQPFSQKPAAHRRFRAVDHRQKTSARRAFENLKASQSVVVEQHEFAEIVIGQPRQLFRRVALRDIQIRDDRARRRNRERRIFQPERLQRFGVKMVEKSFARVFEFENAGIQSGDELRQLAVAERFLRFGDDNFGGRKALQFIERVFIFDFSGGEIARRDVGVGDARALPVAEKRNEIIVGFAVEKRWFDDRSSCYRADDLTVYQTFIVFAFYRNT